MGLLVDGNLAHMFGSEDAALYFVCNVSPKGDVHSLHPILSQE